jgi:hypothetical protein
MYEVYKDPVHGFFELVPMVLIKLLFNRIIPLLGAFGYLNHGMTAINGFMYILE